MDNKEYYEEKELPIPEKGEVVLANWLFKAVILALVPASILIYRSRVLSLSAFELIKKHTDNKGVAYNRCIQLMNNFFIFSGLRSKRYIEYIEFKKANRSAWGKTSETASIACILLWVFIRVWQAPIQDFILPQYYLILNATLLFQKQTLFVIKLGLFAPVFCISLLCKSCFCKKRGRQSDFWRDLGLDPVITEGFEPDLNQSSMQMPNCSMEQRSEVFGRNYARAH